MIVNYKYRKRSQVAYLLSFPNRQIRSHKIGVAYDFLKFFITQLAPCISNLFLFKKSHLSLKNHRSLFS